MSEVKMKTVCVYWTEKVYYRTFLEVPADADQNQIEGIFYEFNRGEDIPVDHDFQQIDYIDMDVSK
jgi:hypothetical protein